MLQQLKLQRKASDAKAQVRSFYFHHWRPANARAYQTLDGGDGIRLYIGDAHPELQ